jgi:ribosomal-protein-alanine N-acetyltransferase
LESTLRPSTPADLETILSWVATPELLKFWGGTVLTFPPFAEQTWGEMEATSQNTFTLIDPQGNVIGFGQALFRDPNTVHLGRIIISPACRGQGFGKILCQQLMQKGSSLHHPAQFTLNVYKDNTPAYRLYASLGFTVISEDVEQETIRMGLRCDPSAKSGLSSNP